MKKQAAALVMVARAVVVGLALALAPRQARAVRVLEPDRVAVRLRLQ